MSINQALIKYVCAVFGTLFCVTVLTDFNPIHSPKGASAYSASFNLTELTARRNFTRKSKSMYNSLNDDLAPFIAQNSDEVPPRKFNETADDMCNSDYSNSTCLKAFIPFEASYKAAPDFKMMHCVVQKSMSTVIMGIMCYLYNRKSYENANKLKTLNEWNKSALCQYLNSCRSIKEAEKKFRQNLNDWSYSMITRDPIDRFLSGYVDRCIRAPIPSNPCNGCDKNLTCFVISEYNRFSSQIARGRLAATKEDRHFYPQNWRCNLSTMLDKYEFIRYSSDPTKELMTDLFKLAQKQRVPNESLEYIAKELTANRRTSHTTAQSPARMFYEKRLRSNPLLMEYVVRMFYYDFVHLKYPFPEGF